MENQKKKSFFFRSTDRPDALPEDTAPTLGYFFKLLWRKIGKLLSLNLMMMVLYLPIIACVIIYMFSNTIPTVESPLYAPLLGIQIGGGSPMANLLLGAFSRQLNIPVLTAVRKVAVIILLSFTALTWGWQNVGATYNLRSLVRGDSCFLVSDYFYAIRRNLKQAFFFGLLDVAIIVVLAVDFFYFSAMTDIFFFGVLYMIFIVLAVMYTVMRFYIYHMMITFDLSVKKILKNALIFVMLGLKRNIAALVGLALLFGVNIALIILGLSVGFSVPLILPIFYLPALAGFIAAYAAWPNIQRYMIDAYESSEAVHSNKNDEDNVTNTSEETSDIAEQSEIEAAESLSEDLEGVTENQVTPPSSSN